MRKMTKLVSAVAVAKMSDLVAIYMRFFKYKSTFFSTKSK